MNNATPFASVCLIVLFVFVAAAVPDGKPQVISAHNTSSTSIYLSWKPPPRSTIHGEFLGYRLAYRQRGAPGPEFVHEIFLRDPAIEVTSKAVAISSTDILFE